MKIVGQLEQLLITGKPYSQGLVHHIYRDGDLIFKVAKINFPDFNTLEHYLIEKNSLNKLTTLGIPVPPTITVNTKIINNKEVFYITESFVDGIQYNWEELSLRALINMNIIYTKIHQVEVKNFGPLNSNLEGSFLSWHDYISSIVNNSKFLGKENKKKVNNIVDKFSLYLDTVSTPRLIFVDFNPGNIFFNRTDDVVGIIDIDHPIGGDPLYDFASVKWYNPKTYEKFKNDVTKFSSSDEKIIDFYCLIQAINIMDWMNKHNLVIFNEKDQFSAQQDLVEKNLK